VVIKCIGFSLVLPYPYEVRAIMTDKVLQSVKPFDASRAVLDDYLSGYPARLMPPYSELMMESFLLGKVAGNTRLLAFDWEGRIYGMPMRVVLSYNVMQGKIESQDWLMTFCNACDTGMVFSPKLEERTLHFQRRGSYDGLLLIWDEETDSYWQHITGECLHGQSAGQRMRVITTTRHMTVSEALNRDSKAVLLQHTLTEEQEILSKAMEKMRTKPERVEAGIMATIAKEDTRRPRFDLGLGVWDDKGSKYFPLPMLYMQDSIWLTEFHGRSLLVYQLPDAVAPVAAYLSSKRAELVGDTIRLDGGFFIQNDKLVNAQGESKPLERPPQLLMRWYGFSLTFPGCELPQERP
jgi:Protein of unknown function (DUF3179)